MPPEASQNSSPLDRRLNHLQRVAMPPRWLRSRTPDPGNSPVSAELVMRSDREGIIEPFDRYSGAYSSGLLSPYLPATISIAASPYCKALQRALAPPTRVRTSLIPIRGTWWAQESRRAGSGVGKVRSRRPTVPSIALARLHALADATISAVPAE